MSTLQNFGIPDGGIGLSGMLQPKVKYKFRVIVTNFGIPSTSIQLTQQVMTVARPTVTFDPVEIQSYNSRAYYAGKPTWGTVTLKVRDDVTNSVSSLIGAQLQKQQNFFQQTSPLSGGNYKFQMFVDALDGGDQTILEEWTYEGCFLTEANYDEHDYGSSDPMTISLTVRFDNATQSGGLMPINPIQSPSSYGGLSF